MEVQIKELKMELRNLVNRTEALWKNCVCREDLDVFQFQRIEEEIQEVRAKMFELTGDCEYAEITNNYIVKKYRRSLWDCMEYGEISLSELYKRKQAKIEIIIQFKKQKGVTDFNVNMKNIHHFDVEEEEIKAYLKNQRSKKKKSINRKKHYFYMLMSEMWTYGVYFDKDNRIEEVHDLVRQVLGPGKRAIDAKFNDIRKIKKLTKMLRNRL